MDRQPGPLVLLWLYVIWRWPCWRSQDTHRWTTMHWSKQDSDVTNVIKHFKQLRIPRSTGEACSCIRMVKRSRWTYNLFFYAGWNVTSAMKQFEQIRIWRNTIENQFSALQTQHWWLSLSVTREETTTLLHRCTLSDVFVLYLWWICIAFACYSCFAVLWRNIAQCSHEVRTPMIGKNSHDAT